jgi:alanine racemase
MLNFLLRAKKIMDNTTPQYSSTYNSRPTWAEIDLNNLAANFHATKEFVGRDLKYMAVVKADGYGHGAVECARRLEKEGIDWFGVALPEEGVELRSSGIRKLILCLGSFWEGQENLLLNYDLTPTIFRLDLAERFNNAAKAQGMMADVHIKIDTGMGRVGVRYDAVREFADRLKSFENLRVDGLMTHLAAADDLKQDPFTDEQVRRFNECVDIFHEKGFHPSYRDLANSPGAVGHPNTRGNMVRIGGILYGLGGDILPKEIAKPELKPVLSLYSRVALLKTIPAHETLGYSRTFETARDSIIATVPIGYQDGYMRLLSNTGRALVNGQYAPIVGRVSMDWILVDVTDIPDHKLGDKVTLIGEENGNTVTAEEVAQKTGTISYEVTCGISARVPRIYIN